MGLPDAKKFENMFTRYDKIHERDRHPDSQTPYDSKSRATAASLG